MGLWSRLIRQLARHVDINAPHAVLLSGIKVQEYIFVSLDINVASQITNPFGALGPSSLPAPTHTVTTETQKTICRFQSDCSQNYSESSTFVSLQILLMHSPYLILGDSRLICILAFGVTVRHQR